MYSLRLFLLLQSFGVVSVAEMSGAVSQGRRKEVLTNFKKGKTQVLAVSVRFQLIFVCQRFPRYTGCYRNLINTHL